MIVELLVGCAATAFLLGLTCNFIRSAALRLIALLLIASVPTLLVAAVQVSDGCPLVIGRSTEERCAEYGYGLFMGLALLAVPFWTLIVSVGFWSRTLFWKLRRH